MSGGTAFDIRRLGAAMRAGRERLGMSGQEAGERAGLGGSYWLRLENEESGDVEIGTLVTIAGVLGMEVGELLRVSGLDVGTGLSGEMGVLWSELSLPQRRFIVTMARGLLRLAAEECGLLPKELDAVLPIAPTSS